MKQSTSYFVILSFLFMFAAWQGQSQNPVDCDNAVIVCSSQQLNYNSNGPGNNDFTGNNSNSNGCLLNNEHQSAWFKIFISPSSTPGATLAFTIDPVAGAGEDYDFALYGPDVGCDNLGSPIRCSYAASSCSFCPQTGLGMGTTDHSEGAGGDGFVEVVETQPGESYILLVDNWLSSSQGFFIDWTGTAILSCDCTTDVTIDGDLEICPGESTTLTANGTNLVDFVWEATNGGTISGSTTTASITATTGTYSVTVTDSESCTGTTSVEVVEAPGPSIEGNITPTTCEQNNGAIDIIVTGGTEPYTFNWSNGESTEDLTDILAGTYSLTVTSDAGCTSTASFNVPNETAPIEIAGNVMPNTSCLQGNGSISLEISPPENYTFTWSNGETTQDISDLIGGTYTVTVTLEGGCTETATITVPDEPNVPQITFTTSPSTCELPNGSIDVTVTQGVPPYTFTWSNGSTEEDLTNVTSGNYTVTITGDNGCTTVETISLNNENPPINIDANISPNTSCNTPNGSISISVTPSGSYTFAWSNGSFNQDLVNVSGGSYTVTVTGDGSCSAVQSFTVPDEPNTPDLSVQTTSTSCELSNGSIDLTVTGGVQPYTYNWSNGASTEDLNGIPSGSYSVTVTGDNGCTSVLNVSLENENPSININPSISPNTTCNGGNGSISISINPAGSYTISWSNGEMGENIENLPGGNYTVTVDGEGSCDETATFNVPNQPDLPVINQTVVPALCGQSNGSIDVTVSGSEAPYSYQWSNGSTNEDLSGIPAGNYSLTVTGGNGCTETANITVPDNTIDFTIETDVIANTNCQSAGFNGSASATVIPARTYTFSWSNGSTDPAISNVEPGMYTLTVSAGGNCTETVTLTIPDEAQAPQLSEAISPANCGLPNGIIDLTTTGGVPPYTFIWSDGSTTEDLQNVPAGTYSLTVTGDNGCSTEATYDIPNNDILIEITGNTAPNTGCVNFNGAVDITVTPQEGYSFAWSNGATTEDIFNLEQGTYSVTVSIGNCSSFATFNVGQAIQEPQITADVEASTCGEANGNIDLTVTGGSSPYTYSWSNGANTEDLTDILPGIYTVTVTDSDGCTSESSFQVQNNSTGFSISGDSEDKTRCDYDDGSIDISVVPAGTYDFSWSNGATTEDIDSLAPGEYSVTVTQDGNCSATSFFTIEDMTASPMISGDVLPENCGQSDGSIVLEIDGGTSPFEFSWSNGATMKDIDQLATGSYTVTVTDENGCESTASFTVPENNVTFTISGTSTPDTSCDFRSGAIDLTVTPAENYSFTWSTGDTTEDLSGLDAGDYTVTVSAGGNCTSTKTYTVQLEQPSIDVGASVTDVLCFGEESGRIDLNVSGGSPPYSFNWTPSISGNPEDPTGLEAGEYEVVVTDQNGCTGSSVVTIEQPSDPLNVICSASSHVSQPGESDGVGSVNISGGTAPYTLTWAPGGSQTDVQVGTFEIADLEEGVYDVTVSDDNGCTIECSFTIEVNECATRVGEMSLNVLSQCGTDCLTAMYDDTDQNLGSNDILQFILHEGSGDQIEGEIERSEDPTFCFDPTTMSLGTTYYISAVVGASDGSGNVVLGDVCTEVSVGQPIVFQESPELSVATPDSITCADEEVELSGEVAVPGASFEWTTSGGHIISDPAQADILVDEAGIYTLIVTMNGCSDTASVEVFDIRNEIEAHIEATPGDVIDCSVSTVSLTGSASGTSNPLYEWYFEDQFVSDQQTINTETPGNYRLVVTDANTFCSDSDSITVEDQTDFPVLFTDPAPEINCRDTEVMISGGSPTDGVQFSWARIEGTDTTIVGEGASISVQEAGTYHLIGLAPNGCENSISLVVEEDRMQPEVSAGENDTLDCNLSPLELTGTSPETVSYQWSGPAGGILTDPTAGTITVDQPGVYILTVIDQDNYCMNSDTVEVNQYDNVPRADVLVEPPTCFGDQNGSILVENDPGNGPFRYILNGEDYGDQNTLSPLAPGEYTLEVEDRQGCTWMTEVTIPEPEPLTVELGPNIFVEEGSSATIDLELSVSPSNLDTILWSPAELFNCEGMPCGMQEFIPEGETDVRVTVIDTNGCDASDALTVFVKKSRSVYIPNTFTPNGDGTNDVFRIYGNDDVAEVESFVIFDRWGERVFERRNFQPDDSNYGWDGRYRGKRLNPAVFVWHAVIRFDDGEEVRYKGDVTLTR